MSKLKDAARDIFTIAVPSSDSITSLTWYQHTVWERGCEIEFPLLCQKMLIWDVQEHNFSLELMTLDQTIVPEIWNSPPAKAARVDKITTLWPNDFILMKDLPSKSSGLAAKDISLRRFFLRIFQELLADWPGETPKKLTAYGLREFIDDRMKWHETALQEFQVTASQFYVGCYLCDAAFHPTMCAYYNSLPTVSHTLDQFIFRVNSMHEAEEYDAFIRACLTGEYTDEEGQEKQIFIDPIQDAVYSDHPLTIKCDYDSLIGVSHNILVDGPINAHAVPPGKLCLKSSIHVRYPMQTENGQVVKVELHHIPNFEFGSFGQRSQVLFFFPRLWSKERAGKNLAYQLTQRERAFWYENALRPAIADLLGQTIASEWPPSYEAEVIRARNNSGSHSWGTRLIPGWGVPLLADCIRQAIDRDLSIEPEDSLWAKDFFVMHIVRGVKHATSHDLWEGAQYLEKVFEDANLLSTAHIDGRWWVDVGLEISSDQGDCLQWMTPSHRHIVEHVLGVSEARAAKITRISHGPYYRDLSSHLTAVSGFRLTLSARSGGNSGAVYMQMYTTDKAAVHNHDSRHHAKFVTSSQALGTEQPPAIINGLHTIYEKARDTSSSKARLEVRVPYQNADEIFTDIDETLLRSSICAFERETWWNFRIIRLMGISQTLYLQESGPSKLRFLDESLLLTAACLWLVNGIHARPEDGPAARDLMRATLPITEDHNTILEYLAYNTRVQPSWQHEEEESDPDEDISAVGVPYNPYGCVFFRRIVLAGDGAEVPRFRVGGRGISPPSFEFWFDGRNKDHVRAKFQRTGIISRDAVAKIRSTTNKKSLVPYVNLTGAPEPTLFKLGAQGYSLPPPNLGQADDLRDRFSPLPDQPEGIDAQISNLWRQFVMDITSKSPNPRGMTNPSHLRLSHAQRTSGDDRPYRNIRLPEVFNAVWYRKSTMEQWRTCFDWLLPKPGHRITDSVQNYHTCLYYRTWMEMLEENRENLDVIHVIRNAFWERIRQWRWIPYAQSDKMWPTSAKKPSSKYFTRWPPAHDRLPAPHILLHSREDPILEPPAEDEDIDIGDRDVNIFADD